MRINRVENQTFKGINISKAEGVLFTRLNTPEKYFEFHDLKLLQEKNPLEISLDVGKFNNLTAVITDSFGKVLYEASEKKYKGLFNFNPAKFIKDVCQKADELNSKM